MSSKVIMIKLFTYFLLPIYYLLHIMKHFLHIIILLQLFN